ncbi:MAG: NADH-quinone oxidoreductase subunit NuoH [Calditrichaeota bacterium]|nr:NADH-quinone oxidoreductase subunit NuoH [Calditrichota bacterium]
MDWFFIIAVVAKIIAIIAVVMGIATLLTWVERKQSAIMQDRLGANRADILGLRIIGLFQPIADAIKMLTKEDYIPPFVNKTLHTLAPVLAFVPVLAMLAAIPFGPSLNIAGREVSMQIADINVGLLYIFAFGGLAVYGAVLAGWGSNNKYALLGGVRASAQMLSYEVCLGLSLVGMIMIYGTLDLQAMVAYQSGYWFDGKWIPKWGLFMQPLAALLFLPAAIAENKRIPFDVPEAESEIIGFFTEYSGMRAGLFMFAEFIEMLIIAMLFSLIFLGGWHIPYLGFDGFNWPWGGSWLLPVWAVKMLQFGALFFKISVMIFFFELVRWTLPRFRYDQVMRLGWVYLLPLAILNVAITGVVMVAVGK